MKFNPTAIIVTAERPIEQPKTKIKSDVDGRAERFKELWALYDSVLLPVDIGYGSSVWLDALKNEDGTDKKDEKGRTLWENVITVKMNMEKAVIRSGRPIALKYHDLNRATGELKFDVIRASEKVKRERKAKAQEVSEVISETPAATTRDEPTKKPRKNNKKNAAAV